MEESLAHFCGMVHEGSAMTIEELERKVAMLSAMTESLMEKIQDIAIVIHTQGETMSQLLEILTTHDGQIKSQ